MTVVFGEAPVAGMPPAAAVMTGGPPPSNSLAWEALVLQVDSASLGGNIS
jgi:hypothetical protein